MKIKFVKFFSLLILLLNISSVYAQITLDDLNYPKDNCYRFGTSDVPEKQVDFDIQPTVQAAVQKKEVVAKSQDLTYADLSIKKMSLEVSKSVECDYDSMQADLSLLWQGAAMRSDTIKFAIYKLSNPDKDKPDSSAVKKVLTTIAGMSTFLGAGTGNPILASAALIGGNTLGIFSHDTKALNYKYTQVTDADMIILIRQVENLQQKLVDMYYDYMTARQLYNMTCDRVLKTQNNYKVSQDSTKEIILITDTFYRQSLDEQMKARGNYFEKRSRLEQLVGNEVFRNFEAQVDNREGKNTQ